MIKNNENKHNVNELEILTEKLSKLKRMLFRRQITEKEYKEKKEDIDCKIKMLKDNL